MEILCNVNFDFIYDLKQNLPLNVVTLFYLSFIFVWTSECFGKWKKIPLGKFYKKECQILTWIHFPMSLNLSNYHSLLNTLKWLIYNLYGTHTSILISCPNPKCYCNRSVTEAFSIWYSGSWVDNY